MTYFRGFRSCEHLDAWLTEYEKYLLHLGVIQKSLDLFQLIGGAPQSGGTHTLGCVYDCAQDSPRATRASRDGGGYGFPRTKSQGFTAKHFHGVLWGGPHNKTTAEYQLTSPAVGLFHGKNGLRNGARDGLYMPRTRRDFRQGIAWMKKQRKPKVKLIVRYVAVEAVLGRTKPSFDAPLLKRRGRANYRARIVGRQSEVVDGVLWLRTAANRWWPVSGGRTAKKRPVKNLVFKPVGFGDVAIRNMDSKISEFEWRAHKAIEQAAGAKIDVLMMQDAGANDADFHEIDENARVNKYRVKRGKRAMRPLLYLDSVADYVERTDFWVEGPNEKVYVTLTVLKTHGVRAGFVNFSFSEIDSVVERQELVKALIDRCVPWLLYRGCGIRNITFGGSTGDRGRTTVQAFHDKHWHRASLRTTGSKVNADRRTSFDFGPLAPTEMPTDVLFVLKEVAVSAFINVVDKTTEDNHASEHSMVSIIRPYYRGA